MEIIHTGLDVGSTTAKIAGINNEGNIVFSSYTRHHADVLGTTLSLLNEMAGILGNCRMSLTVTGSAGMGLAERFSVPFEQEVVAATNFIARFYPGISTLIDIGGEDTKLVFFSPDRLPDMRMNGNCAGGTGAFIDQMAILLGCDIGQMNDMAMQSSAIYPIASRCGVFSKTDVQNLISRNVNKSDIAASIFHAVALQVITTLSRGHDMKPKVLFSGGPLSFIPALREAFAHLLKLSKTDYSAPENATLLSAWGAALSDKGQSRPMRISDLISRLSDHRIQGDLLQTQRLDPIFSDPEELQRWKKAKQTTPITTTPLEDHHGFAYLGIDSGSTTTKIVVIDSQERILFSYYAPNQGNSILVAQKGLSELAAACKQKEIHLMIKGSYSAGYGEDLIRAAFNLNGGIIETIAHYVSAKKTEPDVSFILDIGGQDMKALFIENGALCRMEINEACSSGCGSFIESFAGSLNCTVENFAEMACTAQAPCDLGTRCTVFMNSKVKQFLREGASLADIAAGLSYSVVKNCLFKVLKLKSLDEMGKKIVVQGGTMRNLSIIRAFEKLARATVSFTSIPELMGAYGCALYAKSVCHNEQAVSLEHILQTAGYTTRQMQCHGCENQCFINRFAFHNHNTYYSGNKCEKIYANQGKKRQEGESIHHLKYKKLFERENATETGSPVIGIPRALNLYENYPFWHTLFRECGFTVKLSDPSTFRQYETGIHSVMSDNICFPAKLMHGHIYDLIGHRVDRIFFPYVVYEKREDRNVSDSFNCPIVSGYSDVIKSAINPGETHGIPIDSPAITFKDQGLLKKACRKYLKGLGVHEGIIIRAFGKALAAQSQYEEEMQLINRQLYAKGCSENKLTILLAGRPYHTDPLIQHKVSDMIHEYGVSVITEDIVRKDDTIDIKDTHIITQWSYINRILKAAKWVAQQGQNIHFVQMTSFGCGPDAFLVDEVRSLLKRHHKSLTLLKIDDVSNIGSLKLRVRSLIESLKYNQRKHREATPFKTTKTFTPEDKDRKILAPHFTDYLSPLIPAVFKLAGYDMEILPKSNLLSAETGLTYANNEVCYPATLIAGDLVKALQSGKYDPGRTAVAITQTGGQCRATNYLTLIKNAMTEAGFPQVPVLSVSFGESQGNNQPGFRMNWWKILPISVVTILFSDCLSKFFHASVIREKRPGDALRLQNKYLMLAYARILKNDVKGIMHLISEAAMEYNLAVTHTEEFHKVGIVGEIYLKFNSFASKNVVQWLMDQGIEVAPPTLTNFFMQSFVNRKVMMEEHLMKSHIPGFIMDKIYRIISRRIHQMNEAASAFRYFTPLTDIFEEAENGREIVSLVAQFGEGWLLPAEVVSFARQGINNVLSLQPFGCIANHVVSKGIEKRIKDRYPCMNLLSLDFDSGVSDVNITNRLRLAVNNIRDTAYAETG
jgi:activator of 2-hydroxyglutaryl-CoA dehydratase/predicted nucleotide-binding protein (sugar kinase/HSP70/actin superfamily)